MPDAIVLLKEDHQRVEKLFKEFEGLGDRAFVSKRRVLGSILRELDLHTTLEERHFYPVIRKLDDVEDIVLEGYEEHHAAETTMEELRTMDAEAETFDAKVTVLIEMVRHHIEEEEQEMFPKVREAMGRNDLQALGDTLEQARAAGLPDTYPETTVRTDSSAVSNR